VNKKRWWALGIFILLVVIYMVSSIGKIKNETQATTALSKYLNGTQSAWNTTVYKEGSGQKLALLKIEGIITESESGTTSLSSAYNHRVFLQQIEAAFADPNIKGIILQINSPGGGVYESDEVYHRIMELKAQYKKPLVVYMSQEAASGAYYISMAADKIYANHNTLTGSIGVIISTYNYSELANKIGVQDVTFKSGSNKDLLNPMRPITNNERAIMQELVNESYNSFVDVVARGRQMDRQRVLEIADGRIYSGMQAKTLGLVDELGYLENAIAGTAQLAHTSDPQVLLYENPGPNILDWIMSMRTPTFDLSGLSQQLEQQRSPQLLYISN
jgi:protease-4